MCKEKFELIEPKEVIIKIGALEGIDSKFSILPISETFVTIDDEQWFDGGIRIKYKNLVEGNNRIQIYFEASPILSLGFFLEIEQNFISRKLISIYEPPNYRFSKGILFDINFHYG